MDGRASHNEAIGLRFLKDFIGSSNQCFHRTFPGGGPIHHALQTAVCLASRLGNRLLLQNGQSQKITNWQKYSPCTARASNRLRFIHDHKQTRV